MQISEIISQAGGVGKLAAALGVHHSSVIGWRKAGRLPVARAAEVAELLGIPRHELRPDIWDAPPDPTPTAAPATPTRKGRAA